MFQCPQRVSEWTRLTGACCEQNSAHTRAPAEHASMACCVLLFVPISRMDRICSGICLSLHHSHV